MTREMFALQAAKAGLNQAQIVKALDDFEGSGGSFDASPPSNIAGTARDSIVVPKPLPEKADISTKEALFPRAYEANEQDKPYFPDQVVGAGLDLLSLPGRAVAGTMHKPPTALTPGETFKESMAKKKSTSENPVTNVVESVIRSPATIPSMLVGGPELSAIKGAAGPLLRSGAAGFEQGAVGATINQVDRVNQGEDLNFEQIPKEAVITALFGSAGTGIAKLASEGLKKTGTQTVSSLMRGGQTGRVEGFDIENVFKKYPARTGVVRDEVGNVIDEGKITTKVVAANDINGMKNNIDDIMNNLDVERDKIIERSRTGAFRPSQPAGEFNAGSKDYVQNPDGSTTMTPEAVNELLRNPQTKVDLKDVATKALNRLQIDNPAVDITDKKAMLKSADEMMEMIDQATRGTQKLPLEYAMKFKTDLQKVGSWKSTEFGKVGDPEASAKEKVYNEFSKQLKDAVNSTIEKHGLSDTPIAEINKGYEQLIPVRDVIERRMAISNSNIPGGLSFRDAFMGSLLGIGSMLSGQHPVSTAVAGIGGIAASKALKTGIAGKAERALGEMIAPSNVRPSFKTPQRYVQESGKAVPLGVSSVRTATEDKKKKSGIKGQANE